MCTRSDHTRMIIARQPQNNFQTYVERILIRILQNSLRGIDSTHKQSNLLHF